MKTITELTPQLLRRAATIQEKVALLNKELVRILGQSTNGTQPTGGRRMSPTARRRIAAAQRARWAKARKANADKPATKPAAKKSRMSAAARANVASHMRAYWKAKKAGKKTASPAK